MREMKSCVDNKNIYFYLESYSQFTDDLSVYLYLYSDRDPEDVNFYTVEIIPGMGSRPSMPNYSGPIGGDANRPGTAPVPWLADAGQSSVLPFLAECDPSNDLCDSSEGLQCFSFNNKGPHCTHECSAPTDCEAPSPGCNGMGVCKVP